MCNHVDVGRLSMNFEVELSIEHFRLSLAAVMTTLRDTTAAIHHSTTLTSSPSPPP
jgi:hypothetical protein